MTLPVRPPTPPAKTIADWLALPEDARIELIDGEFIEKAAPDFNHGRSQGAMVALLRGPFDRKPGGPSGPGGWWLGTVVDVTMDGRVYRPDIAGWRRDRMPIPRNERPLAVRPDWICEVVSDSNRTTDTVKKVRRCHQAGVPHYWILDQAARMLTVHRHGPDGYVIVLVAEAHERVRAEPFEAVELLVGELLGDDPE